MMVVAATTGAPWWVTALIAAMALIAPIAMLSANRRKANSEASKADVDAQVVQVTAMGGTVDNLNKVLQSLFDEQLKMREQINSLTEMVDAGVLKKRALQEEVDELRYRLRQITDKLSEITRENVRLEREKNKLEKEKAELTRRVTELEIKLNELSNRIDD